MAGTIQSLTGAFDASTRDLASTGRKLSLAIFNAGNSAQRQTARAELLKQPDFIVQGRADGNADTLTLIDLTAKGVTFPAGTMRVIEVEAFIAGDTAATESGYIHKREMIVGGTTPVLGIVIGAIDTNMAGAVGGFAADPLIEFIMSGNNVTVRYTNEGAAEICNVILHVWVGKLRPILRGV